MGTQDLTEQFIQFYRNYYREEVGKLPFVSMAADVYN
jgi:hypothetical protein